MYFLLSPISRFRICSGPVFWRSLISEKNLWKIRFSNCSVGNVVRFCPWIPYRLAPQRFLYLQNAGYAGTPTPLSLPISLYPFYQISVCRWQYCGVEERIKPVFITEMKNIITVHWTVSAAVAQRVNSVRRKLREQWRVIMRQYRLTLIQACMRDPLRWWWPITSSIVTGV